MKHSSSSSSNQLLPLVGSVGVLLAGVLLTFTPALLALEPEKRPPSRAVVQEGAAAGAEKKAEARSPEQALRDGLEYLLKQQQADGGWGQGGGWRQNHNGGGRIEDVKAEDPADLGNTCVSLVALIRAGDSPAQGEHREAARKAFEFICRQVEKADESSLYVTAVRDTQLQVKIGAYVDTFLAGWALSELKGLVGDEVTEKRREDALNKVVAKIERNQKEDGSFAENKGWAAVLSQGLCSKALNTAARSGAKVSQQALDNDQKQNLAGLDVAKGEFSAPTSVAEPSSAGVSLYRESAKLGGLREKVKSNAKRKDEAQRRLADPAAPAPEKARAQQELSLFAADDMAVAAAQQAVGGKLGDNRFMAGFGNNGGEEFLSYMNLGESMHDKGGSEWETWKGKMQTTLCSAQNGDGSWAGNHCITGRTFCTSAALLTLLVGRERAKLTDTAPATVTPNPSDVPAVNGPAGPAPGTVITSENAVLVK